MSRVHWADAALIASEVDRHLGPFLSYCGTRIVVGLGYLEIQFIPQAHPIARLFSRRFDLPDVDESEFRRWLEQAIVDTITGWAKEAIAGR